ncbi:hypothetical protein [Halobacterium yunchengense]|uniref:hypothetical protein n=1 Tax=Halobacterium yunchengense TaxID=3108497 RepID=UPI00300BBA8E
MGCPHLEYRSEGDTRTFDAERAFCTVTGSFVQPMRADVCNDRYDLHHADHCEIYRDHAHGDGSGDAGAEGDP